MTSVLRRCGSWRFTWSCRSSLTATTTRLGSLGRASVFNGVNAIVALKSRWKPAVRWMLLGDSAVAALLAMLTAVKCPVWLGWVVGMVVPECALWFAALPVVFAAGALLLRRGHRVVAGATVGFCLVALCAVAQAGGAGVAAGARVAGGSLRRGLGRRSRRRRCRGGRRSRCGGRAAATAGAGRGGDVCLLGVDPARLLPGGRAVAGALRRRDSRRELGPRQPHGRRHPAGVERPPRPRAATRSRRSTTGWRRSRRGRRSAKTCWRPLLTCGARARAGDRSRPVRPARPLGGRADGAGDGVRGARPGRPRRHRDLPADRFSTDVGRVDVPGNLDHRLNLEWFLGGTPETAPGAYDSASATTLVCPGARRR